MRAFVLSGGGPLAVAWESGLLAGLAEAGVRPTESDFILGTSAGAIVGAQIAGGRDPAAMAAAIFDEAKGIPPPGAGRFAPDAARQLPALFAKAQSSPDNPAHARAEIGAYALAQPTESQDATAARFAALLGTRDWPARPFGCVVVDIADGRVNILTRDCGASLDRAVAASCSLPGLSPPIAIGDRHYFDGGFASTANADLALGFDEIIVIGFRPRGPSGDRIEARLLAQLDTLRENGARVLAILPDVDCQAAIGSQTMDLGRRPDIARAAVAQGRAEAARFAGFPEN
jgi:NTE family protein